VRESGNAVTVLEESFVRMLLQDRTTEVRLQIVPDREWFD
jgi:hypothetical protein